METEAKLPSAWQLGQDVYLPGHIAGVQFTEGKVHYIVKLGGEEEVLVDSVSVCRNPQP